jgi:hypothetical protein
MHFPATFDSCKLLLLRGPEVPLKGDSIPLIPLLNMLSTSTYAQSLEPSIQGSTNLGLVETASGSKFQLVPQEETLFQ